MRVAETNVKSLKMNTFEYIEGILYNFQEKMEHLNAVYCNEMFDKLQKSFDQIGETLTENRNEIKDLIYRTQMESDKG
jgi:hypothetical protein